MSIIIGDTVVTDIYVGGIKLNKIYVDGVELTFSIVQSGNIRWSDGSDILWSDRTEVMWANTPTVSDISIAWSDGTGLQWSSGVDAVWQTDALLGSDYMTWDDGENITWGDGTLISAGEPGQILWSSGINLTWGDGTTCAWIEDYYDDTIATNLLTLDAIDSLFTFSSGIKINSWEDLSVNDNNAVSANLDENTYPTYISNGWDGSRPCVRFNGIENYLTLLSNIDVSNGFCVFFVAKLNNISSVDHVMIGSEGNNNPAFVINSDGTVSGIKQPSTDLVTTSNSILENTPYIFMLKTDGDGTGTTCSIYINNVLQTVGNVIPTFTNGFNIIGASTYSTSPLNYFDGDVAHISVYDRMPNDIQRDEIVANLATKWNI